MTRPGRVRGGLRVRGYSVSRLGWVDARGEQVWVKAGDVDRKLSYKPTRDRTGSANAPRTRFTSAPQSARGDRRDGRPGWETVTGSTCRCHSRSARHR